MDAIKIKKDVLKTIGLVVVAVILLGITGMAAYNQLTNRPAQPTVYATVNGAELTTSDVQQRQSLISTVRGTQAPSEEQVKQLLVDETLLLQEAERQGITTTRQETEQRISGDLQENGVNLTAYKSRLNQQGISWDAFITYYQERLIIRNVTQEAFNATVSDTEAQLFYTANQAQFTQPAADTVRHILIATQNRTEEEAQSLAQNLSEQLREDEEAFCDLVEQYSADTASVQNCGAYNVSQNGQFVPAFEEAATRLEIDEIDVVNSTFGYHVMQKTGEYNESVLPYEEVEETIKEQLRQRQETAELQRILDDLRENATITTDDPALASEEAEAATGNTTETQQNAPEQTTQEPSVEETSEPVQQTDNTERSQETQSFAACLEEADATLYTTYWSPHSQDQIDSLEGVQTSVEIVECDAEGQNAEPQRCQQSGVDTYPTWELNGELYEGYKTETALRNTLRCTE